VTDPSGCVVVVVVVVFVSVVAWVGVLVVTVPVGGFALGFTTRSVGCTLVAGTTVVASPDSGTGVELVESAGVGCDCAPTSVVFDSTDNGLFAGSPPRYVSS
jgi:hypothetical protein